MEDLFRALPALLKEFDDNETLREAVVFAAWQKTAGNTLAETYRSVSALSKTSDYRRRQRMWKRHLESLSGQMIFQVKFAFETSRLLLLSNSELTKKLC